MLQLGYFKAKRQFFVYEREAVLGDLGYILQKYFPGKELATVKALSKPTRLEQQRVILQLFNFRLCDGTAKAELELKAQRVAKLSTQPVYILREALNYLANQCVVAPGYTYLQDMVGQVVTREHRRITDLLDKTMTPAIKAQLEALLKSDEGMYPISQQAIHSTYFNFLCRLFFDHGGGGLFCRVLPLYTKFGKNSHPDPLK